MSSAEQGDPISLNQPPRDREGEGMWYISSNEQEGKHPGTVAC